MPLPKEKRCTYVDLLSWRDERRYELYSGKVVAMSSPSDIHQEILTALLLQIGNYLRGKKCRVYPAPFDVRLFEGKDDCPETVDTVVQPDLMVVCDPSKVDRHGIHGAPDLVIEITSPSTQGNDWREKYHLYQRAGVNEYWIADPAGRYIAVHHLENGQYAAPVLFRTGARIPLGLWEGFSIDLKDVFAE